MSVIRIEDTPSLDGAEGLLALIVRESFHDDERPVNFFTDRDEPMQLAHISHPRGHVVPPHRHHVIVRRVDRTMEALIVRRGAVWLDVYSSAGTWIGRYLLTRGDVALLLRGAHGLEVAEDADLIEVKQGPYQGRDRDKVDVDVRRK